MTPNSSINSKSWFLNVGHRLYFRAFPNSPRDWKLGFLNISIDGTQCPFWILLEIFRLQNLWSCMMFREILSLNCPKFTKKCPFLFMGHTWSAFLRYAHKMGIFKFPCFHILPDCEDRLSGGYMWWVGGADIHYVTMLWKHYFQVQMRVEVVKVSWGCTAATPHPQPLLEQTTFVR